MNDFSTHFLLDSEALFRFCIVSRVVALRLAGKSLPKAVGLVASSDHVTAEGELRTVSRSSIYRWLRAYERGNVSALRTRSRATTAASKALSDKFVQFLHSEKTSDPAASVPEVIRRARELCILDQHQSIERSTVWRTCCLLKAPDNRPCA